MSKRDKYIDKYSSKNFSVCTFTCEDGIKYLHVGNLNESPNPAPLYEIETYEKHIGEKLPKAFRKYLLNLGYKIYTYYPIMIKLYDVENNKCLHCSKSMNEKCNASIGLEENMNLTDEIESSLIFIGDDGCAFWSYIVTKGKDKGTIWKNAYGNIYKVRDNFTEYLDKLLKE